MRRCTKCKQRRALKSFSSDARRPNGKQSQCNQCRAAVRKQHRARNHTDYVRGYKTYTVSWLRRAYGIGLEQYMEIGGLPCAF